jgi:hypothetical protein
MRVLILYVMVSMAAGAGAQARSVARKPTTAAGSSSAAKTLRFSASGLNNEDDLLRIYAGEFQSVRVDRAGAEFAAILSSYMNDFASDCKAYLPANKVEIMKQVCVQTSQMVNGYGAPVGAASCSQYETVGTGRYADPQVYAAQKAVDGLAAKKMLGNMMGMLTDRSANPLGMAQQMTDQVVQVGTEMESLIRMNSCGSAGLKRFQTNLVHFAMEEEPVVTPGGAALLAASAAKADVVVKEANYSRLLDDLVADNARGWMMNRYESGSIDGVNVALRDAQGRPMKVSAQYSFSGMQGTQRGGVTLTFKDGSPDCLYFSDFPTTCRLPSQRVVSAYEKNQYAQ